MASVGSQVKQQAAMSQRWEAPHLGTLNLTSNRCRNIWDGQSGNAGLVIGGYGHRAELDVYATEIAATVLEGGRDAATTGKLFAQAFKQAGLTATLALIEQVNVVLGQFHQPLRFRLEYRLKEDGEGYESARVIELFHYWTGEIQGSFSADK